MVDFGRSPTSGAGSRSRYGVFIHWGPYAAYGRGEQVLFREHLDPREYEQRACVETLPTTIQPSGPRRSSRPVSAMAC